MLVIEAEPDDFPRRLQAFRPPIMAPRAAELARRLAVPREPIEFAKKWRIGLTPVADKEAWQDAGQAVEIDLRIDGERAHFRVCLSALEAFLHDVEPRVSLDDLDTELCAVLVESHIVGSVERLEEKIGGQCSFERIVEVRDHCDLPEVNIRLWVGRAEDFYPASVFASPRILGLLSSAWEQSRPSEIGDLATSFTLAARVAVSSVSRVGLASLAVGDALLFDRVAPDGGIVLCLGEYLSSVGEIAETGEVVAGEVFSVKSPLSLGEFLMSDDDLENGDAGSGALDDVSLGALPVRLVFELGRREMTLDELRELGVGAPIPLEKPASSVVDILANGRRVGAGEMVLIGDQLGVRITRLNGHA